MEPKLFFEVFQTLELTGNLRELFEEVKVERVSTTRRQDILRVYITSERLISFSQLRTVSNQITKQLFSGGGPVIRISPKFKLSAQYDLKNLFEAYKESIGEEIKEYNHMVYDLWRQAEVTFPEDGVIEVVTAEGLIAEEKGPELEDILLKIFTERCGLNADIRLHFERKESEPEFDSWESIVAKSGINYSLAMGENSKAASDNKADEKSEEKSSNKSAKSNKNKKNENDKIKPLKRTDDPEVLYGRDVIEEAMPIEDIQGEIGEVIIRGMVVTLDTREIKNDRTIVIFTITDFTDTITSKIFVHNDQVKELTGKLKPGAFIKLRGICMMDKFDHELSIGSLTGIRLIPDFRVSRVDDAPVKRVELHCHTKMSDMDGVSECKDLVKRAYSWGMPAIAITDHGVVQAFPDANHVWEDLWGAEKKKRIAAGDKNPDKQDFFKVIYGVEGYLVDDLTDIVTWGGEDARRHAEDGILDSELGDERAIGESSEIQINEQDFIDNRTYVVFDIETTGLSPVSDRIIEIGAVKVKDGEVVDRFSTFVNPQIPIPFRIEKLTSIRDDMVMNYDTIEVILPRFLEFIGGDDTVLVAHNANFDMSFIRENMKRMGMECPYTFIDTMGIARILLPNQGKHTLDAVAKSLGVDLENHHRAVDDAECTAWIFIKLVEKLHKDHIDDFVELNKRGHSGPEMIRKQFTYHVIILAKNNVGRMNLYKLVSLSHLDYFARRPRIPKSMLNKYREGLIVGSACEAGELYHALLENQSEEQISRIVDFYDYLEVQPVGNNKFMIMDPNIENVNSEEDIQNLNRQIIKLGEKWNKPVVATCDVHFMNPEDEIYRRIIMAGMGFDDADNQAPLYLRTTNEMLKEFEYLGDDKAYEIVVTNTRRIADMIDSMSPVRPDKCPPVIENSDGILREICNSKAHEIYGPDLPEIVEERMERELNSIIGNGFAVMYIIAQKLVWKSVEDGYLVGSRGSVGSSFVAFLAGITEVNSLSPHYYCPECHYYDFDSPEVKAFGGMAGCDMPDKVCPVCGSPLKKDGFDIPFETFLGFKGDKEPDIDLNFSGEYQSKAHKYTEVIFGYGQTYRAGTIAGLADKTAYGYVKNYYEERGITKRRCELDRIVTGCTGIRRSTGQHPGGIVVLPVGEEIYSFTPVQHPANDMTTATITTHFDYHSIDHNLLKLDILGHDDPTMIRMLQDLTGINPVEIPLDDKGVMSLFQSTEALNITPDDIMGTKLGCLGIPEFGTEFAMQMLIDTQPQYFSDLVRIAGLAHGTDVWLGNAQTLIQEKKATISTAICCRDDIMIYLIQMGVESEKSFKIMEMVRKGNVAKGKCDKWPEWKEDMKAHNVPDWYIWSCEKIKYMFPKAHAAAYVMMAWRIAYCKINYPLAFYAAFFTIRASGFSYELMCQGKMRLEQYMAEYKARMDELSPKEQNSYKDMKLVQEMYARGFDFMPIDLNLVDAKKFQIIDGKIMPSLSSIDGIGENAAEAIVEATKDGPFLSKDDFKQRTKASKTSIDKLDELGILGDLPESNQISLFDFMS